MQNETALRKQLKADLGNLNVVLEKSKTGKGLTQGMYDRLKSYYPDIDNDDLETIKTKMNFITKEAETYYKAAQLRAEHGADINPIDIEDLNVGHNQPQEPLEEIQHDKVLIKGPSGKTRFLSPEEAEDFLRRPGYMRVQ